MRRQSLIGFVVVLASCNSTGETDPPGADPEVSPKTPPDPEMERLRAELEAAETARNELLLEVMILRFGQGAKSFRGNEFDDRKFVEEIVVNWEAVQRSLLELTSEQRRVLSLLPGALRDRYNREPVPKGVRFEASRALVAALMSRHDTIRKAAIDSLESIYGVTWMYRHDAPAEHRAEKHKQWVSEIYKHR